MSIKSSQKFSLFKLTKKRKPESFLFCLTNHDTLYPKVTTVAKLQKKINKNLDKSYLKPTFTL